MTKEELQEKADHYLKVGNKYHEKCKVDSKDIVSVTKMWFYLGKRETCLDLIKKMEDEA